MKSFFKSVPFRLSLRFSILLTVVVFLLATAFYGMTILSVRSDKSEQLIKAADTIAASILNNDTSEIHNGFPALPYFIYYTVYDLNKTGDYIISTNDSSIPLLADTNGKAKTFFEKDYYLDGDINILYYAQTLESEKGSLIIQTNLNMDTDSMSKMINEFPKIAVLLLVPVLIISFFISLFITRRTLKPVVEITASAKKISSSNLESQLPLTGKQDELDELASTFNSLFEQLKSDFDRERQFTSDVSHELKTPVAVILGQSNLLRRWGKNDPVQLEKSLNTIISETKSMEAIISNLLQMSRLESGRVQPEMEQVNLQNMFERLKTETLSVKPSAEFIYNENQNNTITADPELLHQVFTVIISNSLKFTPDPVKITMNCKPLVKNNLNPYSVHIQLCDNGPGFGEESINHVFERFYREDAAHTRSAGGSGLGLSIAKTIIESMNGSIYAENNSEAHGAVINIML